jgi:site-specific DNA recombinase
LRNRFLTGAARVCAAVSRLTEVCERLATLRCELVDEREVVQALSLFDPVWDSLTPREQARIVRLLVERVDYDGKAGTVAVTFRSTGIKTLAQGETEDAA